MTGNKHRHRSSTVDFPSILPPLLLNLYLHVVRHSVMSGRNRSLNTKDGVLPPNPEWITFEDTDGDVRRWPTNTTPVLDAEGHVNYMLPLDVDHPNSIKWRMISGASIAEYLKYQDYGEFLGRPSFSASEGLFIVRN